MKLNRLTDYAVILLSQLAQSAKRGEHASELGLVMKSAGQLSAETAMPLPTTSKVLKQLAAQGLVISTRGAQGGYALATAASEISVADIILAVEGPIALTACVEGSDDACAAENFCAMRGNWDRVNKEVLAALRSVRLPDMAPQFAWDVSNDAQLTARA